MKELMKMDEAKNEEFSRGGLSHNGRTTSRELRPTGLPGKDNDDLKTTWAK